MWLARELPTSRCMESMLDEHGVKGAFSVVTPGTRSRRGRRRSDTRGTPNLEASVWQWPVSRSNVALARSLTKTTEAGAIASNCFISVARWNIA